MFLITKTQMMMIYVCHFISWNCFTGICECCKSIKEDSLQQKCFLHRYREGRAPRFYFPWTSTIILDIASNLFVPPVGFVTKAGISLALGGCREQSRADWWGSRRRVICGVKPVPVSCPWAACYISLALLPVKGSKTVDNQETVFPCRWLKGLHQWDIRGENQVLLVYQPLAVH